nr:E3 ubiquitin-protein ligase MARCH5-like [Halyomorpha halys]
MPSDSITSRSSGRQCWICFATEEDDPNQTWTKPCKCKGTTKWVHQRCLLMWIDLKAKNGKTEKILCPQCKMEYTIYYPPSNLVVHLLDIMDSTMFRFCPFMAGAIMVLMVYWSSVSYGVIAMIQQVLGPEATRQQLESSSPAVLLVALPSLPVLLLGFSFFQWEDRMLLCLRKYGPRVPLLRHVLPAPV